MSAAAAVTSGPGASERGPVAPAGRRAVEDVPVGTVVVRVDAVEEVTSERLLRVVEVFVLDAERTATVPGAPAASAAPAEPAEAAEPAAAASAEAAAGATRSVTREAEGRALSSRAVVEGSLLFCYGFKQISRLHINEQLLLLLLLLLL